MQGADDAHVTGRIGQGWAGKEGQDARHPMEADPVPPCSLGHPGQQLHVSLCLLCGHELAAYIL